MEKRLWASTIMVGLLFTVVFCGDSEGLGRVTAQDPLASICLESAAVFLCRPRQFDLLRQRLVTLQLLFRNKYGECKLGTLWIYDIASSIRFNDPDDVFHTDPMRMICILLRG